MSQPGQDLLTHLLKDVSRTFYLTLRLLPNSIRPQIGLAYLLARTTDTIADTNLLPVALRLQGLRDLRQRILALSKLPINLKPWFPDPSPSTSPNPAERQLLSRLEEMLCLLESFPASDQSRIRHVLQTIISGQELDLERFGQATPNQILCLDSAQDLEDYTYRVAGCVGEFWTHLCLDHLFPKTHLYEPDLFQDAVRFGKGLQLTNVLRDLPADLRNGRCYLPGPDLTALGLTPLDLLNPRSEAQLRPLYNTWLARARDYLQAGWRYTLSLPRSCHRVRLACAWPLLIGIQTLHRLYFEPILDPNHRVKISRSQVRQIVLRSLLLLPFRQAWERQFDSLNRIDSPNPLQ